VLYTFQVKARRTSKQCCTISANMEFRIADTFLDSLSGLTGEEKKAAKTTVFDLQANPADPGLSFHRLDKARDSHFWSVRVSRDIRLIVHKTGNSLLICYVDHHDKAYAWAERRKLETHPKTGEAKYTGVKLADLFKLLAVQAAAKTLVLGSSDGYTSEVALSDIAASPDALLAIGDDGTLNLVMPGMAGKAWAKDVTSWEFK